MAEEDADDELRCDTCGTTMESDECWNCLGEGEFDCYEDDAINFAPGEEYETCQECDGTGVTWWCPNKKCPDKVP